jgi:hypothetical protein
MVALNISIFEFRSYIVYSLFINQQTKKENQRLGMIKRSFDYMDKDMFLTVFKSIVRPHLEYGSSVWSVIYKKEAIQLENVQRRATKLIKNIQHKTYTQRLKYLGLPSLQYRRLPQLFARSYIS